MSFYSNLKNWAGNFLLKKELQRFKRNRKPASFQSVKTVGLLYVVPEEKDFPYITDFVKFFQDNGKVVKALGFTNTDFVPHYCFPKLTYDYFTRKNSNWYGKPNHKFVDDFMENDYDLLIDLTTSPSFTMGFIGYLCKSKFKMGAMNDANVKHYDLMMQIDPNIPINEYITHIKHYLTNLNIISYEQNA